MDVKFRYGLKFDVRGFLVNTSLYVTGIITIEMRR